MFISFNREKREKIIVANVVLSAENLLCRGRNVASAAAAIPGIARAQVREFSAAAGIKPLPRQTFPEIKSTRQRALCRDSSNTTAAAQVLNFKNEKKIAPVPRQASELCRGSHVQQHLSPSQRGFCRGSPNTTAAARESKKPKLASQRHLCRGRLKASAAAR